MPAARNAEHDGHDEPRLIPAEPSPRILRVFTWYTRRLFRKRFHAVRIATDSITSLRELDDAHEPMIVLLNHASWWDPLIGVLLADAYLPSRCGCAPMDAAQLQKFKFMRKLGLFGIDPDDPAAEQAMHAYVATFFADHAKPTLWITPQGSFADVRAPIRLRPGAAAIAARCEACRVISIAIEYSFWQDQRPEVFLRAAGCETATQTTTGWQRAMTETMRDNSATLAERVIARDPAAFTCIVGGERAKINPLYDLLLRLRGKSSTVTDQHRAQQRNSRSATDTNTHAITAKQSS